MVTKVFSNQAIMDTGWAASSQLSESLTTLLQEGCRIDSVIRLTDFRSSQGFRIEACWLIIYSRPEDS